MRGNQQVRTAAQIAALMAILTLISKIFGFIREAVMAGFFGAGYITDSYVMAQSIPGILLGGIFAAVSTAYMPLYSDLSEKNSKSESDLFTSRIINILLILSGLASIVGFFFADNIVGILASNFDAQRAGLTVFYVKITFLYTFFSSVAGILDAYLQYKGHFFMPIIAGYALNIMAIGVIIFSAYTSYGYLALGMLFGQMGRCLILVISVKKTGFRYSMSIRTADTVKQIIVLAMPVFISSSIQQINTFVDKSLASGLEVGCVSALYYAMLIVTLITGLTTSIFSTIMYPKIAQAKSQENYEAMSEMANTVLNLIIIITVPFSFGILAYGEQVVQIIFERGAFDMTATALTGSALIFYGVGLPFLAINEFLLRLYYSLQEMKKPMIFAGIGVLVNVVLNLILVNYMRHNGLALATSIAFAVNMLLLARGIHKNFTQIRILRSKQKVLKIILAAAIAVGISFAVYHLIILKFAEIIFMKVIQLLLAAIIAAIVYLALLIIFKVEEVKLLKTLKDRKS